MQTRTIKNCGNVEIEYWFYDEPKMEMSQADYDHVQKQIRDDYNAGELCGGIGGDYGNHGGWQIKEEAK